MYLFPYKGPRGEWSEPLSIDAINTTGHDAAIYLSQDGQRLFIYRNLSSGNGDIYESKQMGSSWTKPEKVKGINSNAWEEVCVCRLIKKQFILVVSALAVWEEEIFILQLCKLMVLGVM
ncbi:MAG: PD40 domain-containing protein [Bacteroidetes bacterium]|nr:PD40 domain-containing protein [Bacteroidota bacterium]